MSIRSHFNWLVPAGITLNTQDGKPVTVYKFLYDEADGDVMSTWAKHFRNHYCSDDEINFLIEDTGLSKADFLKTMKFPGPSIRAGDFGEILIADYLQYVLDYWVPRTRYDRKVIANESSKGSDVIAFRFEDENEYTPDDQLIIVEVKTQFSGNSSKNRLQDAVDDSIKDFRRKAESLNAIKQRLIDRNMYEDARKVGRFQNIVDKPYRDISGAAALFSTNVFDMDQISETDTSSHPNDQLVLIVIHAKDFMPLVHTLYERAANEA